MGLQESGGSERRIRAEDRCGSILIGIVTLLQMPQDANDENIFHHLTFGPGTNSGGTLRAMKGYLVAADVMAAAACDDPLEKSPIDAGL